MKKIIILFSIITLFTACKSKEDKALALINQYMKTILYDYNSYEPTQIKIDSAYTNIYVMNETRAFAKTIIDTEPKLKWEREELKSNLSSMAIWKPERYSSEYTIFKYNEAKKSVEENKKTIAKLEKTIQDAKDGIKAFANNFKPQYVGWNVNLNYRCKTGGGYPAIGNGIFFIDPDFKEIIFSISDLNKEELEIVETIQKYSEQ